MTLENRLDMYLRQLGDGDLFDLPEVVPFVGVSLADLEKVDELVSLLAQKRDQGELEIVFYTVKDNKVDKYVIKNRRIGNMSDLMPSEQFVDGDIEAVQRVYVKGQSLSLTELLNEINNDL